MEAESPSPLVHRGTVVGFEGKGQSSGIQFGDHRPLVNLGNVILVWLVNCSCYLILINLHLN